jgi:hypothetical protein
MKQEKWRHRMQRRIGKELSSWRQRRKPLPNKNYTCYLNELSIQFSYTFPVLSYQKARRGGMSWSPVKEAQSILQKSAIILFLLHIINFIT